MIVMIEMMMVMVIAMMIMMMIMMMMLIDEKYHSCFLPFSCTDFAFVNINHFWWLSDFNNKLLPSYSPKFLQLKARSERGAKTDAVHLMITQSLP